MYERLLLTNDGSELADAAVPRAAALARAMGSQVIVLRVSHAAGEAVDQLNPDVWERQIKQAGAEVPGEARPEAYPPLSLTVTALREAGVGSVGSLVVQGEPGEAIVEAAVRLQCDAIVMASHGVSGIRRALLGSVTDHVIRNSHHIPVLLYRPLAERDDGTYRKLLVALDGSELSATVIPYVQEIAAKTNAEVILLRVTDSELEILTMTTPAGYSMPGGLSGDVVEDIVRAQRASATEQLDAVERQLQSAGVASITPLIAEGDPGREIVSAAEQLGCDLVVLATHGRGGLGRALLGSVTDYVASHLSSAAALIVPATE